MITVLSHTQLRLKVLAPWIVLFDKDNIFPRLTDMYQLCIIRIVQYHVQNHLPKMWFSTYIQSLQRRKKQET